MLLALFAMTAAACGNSGDDNSDEATEDTEPSTVAADDDGDGEPAESEDDRDTFVEISGVPGVTDDEISFDVIGTRSNNPLGTCILDCYTAGIQAYFDYRNEQGGIYGRDLVIGDVLDDELAQNQVRAIDVISSDKAFGVFNATLVASGFGDLDSAGVPTFVWNIHATDFAGRPSIFGHMGAACSDCTQRSLPYLVAQTGAQKVATLGYGVSENSKVCTQALRDSIELYSDSIGGAEVAYFNDELAFGLPNGIGPEVSAMKQAGIEFIGSCMDLNGMKTLGQELQRQGMEDVVMSHPNSYDQGFISEAGGIFEGDFVTPQFLPFEADSGNELQAAFEKHIAAQGQEPTELAMVGFINADTAFTALLQAGPDFDRQKAIDGMNSVTDYSAGGLVPPIDWTTQHTPPTRDEPFAGLQCTAAVEVVDGEFQTVADPSTPFLCWDNTESGWTEPEQMAFGDR